MDVGLKRDSTRKSRVVRHIFFALAAIGLEVGILLSAPEKALMYWSSMGFGYVSLLLLSITLIIGPWNIISSRPNALSINLRRDIGIWAAIFGLIHVVAGIQVHFGPRILPYFIKEGGSWLGFLPFAFGNYTGLGATLVLILLLATSNNISLRRLGPDQWKKVQRFNYICGFLTILHGFAYQFVEKRDLGFVALFLILILLPLAFQISGFKRVRRQSRMGS